MEDTDLADVVAPGTILADKYQVVRLLGRGGMGIVVEARHLRLGHGVALKLLRSSVRSMGAVTARFEREGRAAARLQGPHVARVLDVDVLPDGSPFMVMELLRGKELGDELNAHGKLPIRDAVGYILQACAAMAEAHRAGIIHRDLKPSNLFICEDGGRRLVKVLDFGISKLAGDVEAAMTTTATAFGTPLYMSPEQVRSAKHVDERSDVWSLGVVLYELLAGVTPFNRESATGILAAIIADKPPRLEGLRADVPSGLAKAVMKTLEKNPSARFQDVLELASAIAPYGPPVDDPSLAVTRAELAAPRSFTRKDGRPGAFAHTTPHGLEGAGRFAQRHRLLLGLAALVIAASIMTIFVVTGGSTREAPAASAEPAAQTATAPPPASATVQPAGPEPVVTTADPARSAASSAPAPTASGSQRRKPGSGTAPTPSASSAPTVAPPDPKYL